MNDSQKEKLFEFLAHITVKRWAISLLTFSTAIALYVLFENRQAVFETVKSSASVVTADFRVVDPNEKQHALVQHFMDLHPEIALVTLVDADPVTNRRVVIHRFSNDPVITAYFKKLDIDRPGYGDGALFTEDVENNQQVIAVTNGEYRCSDVAGGLLAKGHPELAKNIVRSCRIPVPPAFRKSGGWFTVHLKAEPDMALLKSDGLLMSFLYFEEK